MPQSPTTRSAPPVTQKPKVLELFIAHAPLFDPAAFDGLAHQGNERLGIHRRPFQNSSFAAPTRPTGVGSTLTCAEQAGVVRIVACPRRGYLEFSMGQAHGGLQTRVLGAPIEEQDCFFALRIRSPAGRSDHEIDHAVAHAARLEQPELPEGVLGPDLAANRLGDMNRYLRVGKSTSRLCHP